MFAVPGWSISANVLKTQIINSEDSKHELKNTKEKLKESTKKRKRKTTTKEVTSENFADLWEEVIEGNSKKKKKKTYKGNSRTRSGDLKDSTPKDTLTPSIVGTEKSEPIENSNHGKRSTKKTFAGGASTSRTMEANNSAKAEVSGTEKLKKHKKKKGIDLSKSTDTSKQLNNKSTSSFEQSSRLALTPLQAAMREKLISARFRYLNQKLYSAPSYRALNLFQENPEMFSEYHEGFRRQVEVWPENPVNSYIAEIKTRGKIMENKKGNNQVGITTLPLPRTNGTCSIADSGCGEATLSTELQSQLKHLCLNIRSFDLQSVSNLVTKADITNLPLTDGSIDVAIFCLALMGTNWIDFIEESYRVLRWKGELWVAEIKSRFARSRKCKSSVVEHSVGNRKRLTAEVKKQLKQNEDQIDNAIAEVEVDGVDDKGGETDVSAFVEILKSRGFVLRSGGSEAAVDLQNRMFVKMYFIKGCAPTKGKFVPSSKTSVSAQGQTWQSKSKKKRVDQDDDESGYVNEASVLKPCVYKLR